jgi:anti-anti-sigma regulatory factor
MLRITENFENGKTVRLRLDGTISRDAIPELIETFSSHRDGSDRTIILDMAGVDFINDQAARELVNILSDQLRIINCSPFITTLLEIIAKRESAE